MRSPRGNVYQVGLRPLGDYLHLDSFSVCTTQRRTQIMHLHTHTNVGCIQHLSGTEYTDASVSYSPILHALSEQLFVFICINMCR